MFHRLANTYREQVSLFTREWIEMSKTLNKNGLTVVSLFTREWIEMFHRLANTYREQVSLFTREWIEMSKTLNKNGLTVVSLFTREWIEISYFLVQYNLLCLSPSLRGSGLKLKIWTGRKKHNASPSLRGSGLKFHVSNFRFQFADVSLFTREWIEICDTQESVRSVQSPSLRGSGLKSESENPERHTRKSPSLRGSGLKFFP